ncbi:NADPH-dependent FMN reductase [Lacticaseibacillus thailandensis]|uniref:NADPH-dependent FMN reductase n=1 Tax=Lacticaseibacillus thailandensis TaxID=381741 RepID=UPI000A5B006E|nr:NAD(P)H-dependent oxidoreductase [Lacticaseibacillus thailandensis]
MTKKIAIISGSNRPGRVAPAASAWLQQQLATAHVAADIIDLAQVNLPFLPEAEPPAEGHYTHASTRNFAHLIDQYAGFVLVFGQYNWGYPAVLKNALDTVYAEWRGKPVATLIYGNHTMQADIAIRLVINGLRMRQLATNIATPVPASNDATTVAATLDPFAELVPPMAAEFAALI